LANFWHLARGDKILATQRQIKSMQLQTHAHTRAKVDFFLGNLLIVLFCLALFGFWVGGAVVVAIWYLLCAGPRRQNQTSLHGWTP